MIRMPDVFSSDKKSSKKEEEISVPKKVPETEKEKKVFSGHNHSRLSSFYMYPDNVGFETKEDKEKIILLLRQHPIVNLKWISMTILLLFGPALLSLFSVFDLLPSGFSLVISLVWYMVTLAYAVEGFLGWYFNVYFVTTNRVIDVDFYNLIGKRVSNAEIEMVQDVSYETGGVIRTLLNYGDVFIQTAAEVSEFKFEAVPSPEKVAKVLDDLRMQT